MVASAPASAVAPAAAILYRHYKGAVYQFLYEATLEADLTPMIVYRAPDGAVWIRPRAVFLEWITVDGARCQRFTRIE